MRILLAGVALCVVSALACGSTDKAANAAPSSEASLEGLSVEATFHGLWWSPAQMEGLNPDAPPPKTTDVVLTSWESSDPVGSPHPDTVTAVVVLRNRGASSAAGLTLTIAAEWQDGAFSTAGSAAWGPKNVLHTASDVAVAPGAADTLRVSIAIGDRVTRLFAKQQWPYALRVSVAVVRPPSLQTLAEHQAVLMIHRGD